MLSVQDPAGNRVPLPENPSKYETRPGIWYRFRVPQQTHSFQKFSWVPVIWPVPLSGQQREC